MDRAHADTVRGDRGAGTTIAYHGLGYPTAKGINRVGDIWSKADLHIHSDHSDGLASVPEIMEYVANCTDLSVIAITDHNTIEGALFAQSLSEFYDFDVVVGSEISSSDGHILGLFLIEDVPAGMSPADTISAIEDQGGVAIIAHPFSNKGVFGPLGRNVFADAVNEGAFRALEVYNSLPFLIWANRAAAKLAGGAGIALTGGSDAHVLQAVGKGYTVFRGSTAEDLRKSIDCFETRAEAQRGSLSLAARYVWRYRAIRRMQAWNWERCKARER